MAPSALLVIIVGIALALLIDHLLGVIVIVIGLAMLLWPLVAGRTRRV